MVDRGEAGRVRKNGARVAHEGRPGATHPRSTRRAQQGRQTALTLCDEPRSEQNVAQHGQQEPTGDAPLHYCRRRIASWGMIVVRKAPPALFENKSVKLGALGACCIT